MRRRAKKGKKGAVLNLWQALLLTGMIIAAAIGVSLVAIGVIQKDTPPLDVMSVETAAPEVVDTAAEVPATKIPATKAPNVEAPAAKTTVANTPPKAPVAKTSPEKTPAPTAPPKTSVPSKPVPVEKAVPSTTRTPTETASPQETKAPPPERPQPKPQGTIVFVIDDAGNNLSELEPFLRFPGPLTIAVLPGLPHSAEAARRIRAAGKEVFLHQPMEAVGGQDPGPGAIYAGMDAAAIRAILAQNIAEIGPIAGMNNHQGSKITMDRQIMETVLAFCREQGICFLDSRTTAETAVPAAARNLGIKIGERNIFIDNEQNRPAMTRYIESALALASQKGSAVMIGHTWSPDLAPLLTELHQNLLDRGYIFATASEFIR